MSKLESDGCSILLHSKTSSDRKRLISALLESISELVPRLLLLTIVFTLLLLLMHNSLGSGSTPTAVEAEQDNSEVPFIVPSISSPKPTQRPFQPLLKGMPCGDIQSRFPDSIPPVVHWTTKDGRVHNQLINTVKSWLQLNNDSGSSTMKWHFMHWDDIQISQLVKKHYPKLSKSYANLTNGLERSDIGRLVVLHHVGGLYVDMDVELRRDPSLLLKPQFDPRDGKVKNSSNCRTALWSQEPPEHAEFIYDLRWLISNAAMMSRANHSFLSYVLDAFPSWYEARWANKRRTVGSAVYVTGPIMLQTFYDKFAALKTNERPDDWCDGMVSEPEVFQPIMDNSFTRSILKQKCATIEKLSEAKQELCRHAMCNNFKNRPVPSSSYTVHHFMHLSYGAMKLDDSQCILRLLPVLTCKI